MGRVIRSVATLCVCLAAIVVQQFSKYDSEIPFKSRALGMLVNGLMYVWGMRTDSRFPFSPGFLRHGTDLAHPEGRNGVISQDVVINENITARIFSPLAERDASGRLPTLVWYHGGGFFSGSARAEATIKVGEFFAREGGWLVIAPEYRLAPEHRFPAGAEDCWTALEWLAQSGHYALRRADRTRVVIGGDSAGGNLAGVTSYRWARQGLKGVKLVHQILLYPVGLVLDETTLTCSTTSCLTNRNAPLHHSSFHDFYVRLYLPERDADARSALMDSRLSLLQPSLQGVPPTHVVLAKHDPLHDEGAAYAEALRAAGVACEVDVYADVHGFVNLDSDVFNEVHAQMLERARPQLEAGR